MSSFFIISSFFIVSPWAAASPAAPTSPKDDATIATTTAPTKRLLSLRIAPSLRDWTVLLVGVSVGAARGASRQNGELFVSRDGRVRTRGSESQKDDAAPERPSART